MATKRGTAALTHQARRHAPWVALSALAGALACASSPGSTSLYQSHEPPLSDCSRSVQWLEVAQVARPYHELARLSATCPLLLPSICEQRLLGRACGLGADAVVVLGSGSALSKPNTLPLGKYRTSKSEQVYEALAIHYTTPGAHP